jgi:hypothetical protein
MSTREHVARNPLREKTKTRRVEFERRPIPKRLCSEPRVPRHVDKEPIRDGMDEENP